MKNRQSSRRLRRHGRRQLSATWVAADRLLSFERPPTVLRPWIADSGSLTQRLARTLAAPVQVAAIRQAWRPPNLGEAAYLGSTQRETCLIRQVRLCVNEQAFVLARTVMPRAALSGRYARLRRLGARPLGDILYADPRARRQALEVAHVKFGHPLLQGEPGPAWARRSLMQLSRGRAIVIYELFLPALVERLS